MGQFDIFYFNTFHEIKVKPPDGTPEFFKSLIRFHFVHPAAGNDDVVRIAGCDVIEFQKPGAFIIEDIERHSGVSAGKVVAADIVNKLFADPGREPFI